GEGGGDDRDFEDDVIKPVPRERRFRMFHDLLLVAADNCFSTVVVASHSPWRGTVLRRCATKPRCSKKPSAVSLASAEIFAAPRAAASFSSASHSVAATRSPATAGWM